MSHLNCPFSETTSNVGTSHHDPFTVVPRLSTSGGVLAVGELTYWVAAMELAIPLKRLAPVDRIIFTNGHETLARMIKENPSGNEFEVDNRQIRWLQEVDIAVDVPPLELGHTKRVKGIKIHFTDQTTRDVYFLFHNPFTKPRGVFVRQLGLKMTPSELIETQDDFGTTSVPGVFAAGNCMASTRTRQVAPFASASGHLAAFGALRVVVPN